MISLWCSNCLTRDLWESLKQDSMASESNPLACSVWKDLETSLGWNPCCPSACTLDRASWSHTASPLQLFWMSLGNALSLHTRWPLPRRKPLSPSPCLPWSRLSSSLNSEKTAQKQPLLSPSDEVPGTETRPDFLPLPLSTCRTTGKPSISGPTATSALSRLWECNEKTSRLIPGMNRHTQTGTAPSLPPSPPPK